MSIAYLIAHTSNNKQTIDLAMFEIKLRERWASVTVDRQPATSALYWEIDLGESILEGRILSGGDCVSLEGYVDDVAQFVVWYRSLVPRTEQLIMFDSGYNIGEIEITEATSADDITAKFWGES